MSDTTTKIETTSFPRISSEILNRLGTEADYRTAPPESVDWKEIHARAKQGQTHDGAGDADQQQASDATSQTKSARKYTRRKFGFLAHAHRLLF